MSKIPTEIMPETGNYAEIPLEAEPVGDFVVPETEKSAAATKAKKQIIAEARAPERKCPSSALLLFAAGLSGAFIAFSGNIALQKAGFYPASFGPVPPAPHEFIPQVEKQVLEERINALFAQKSRQLNEQTAEAAQILQDLTDKAAQTQQMQNNGKAQAALDKISALSQKLESHAEAQAVDRQDLAFLKDSMAAIEQRNQEILSKTNALREEVAVLYNKRQKAQREVAQLLAVQNLQSTFDSGRPYRAELQIFNAAFPHALDYVPLMPEQQRRKQEQAEEDGPFLGQKSRYPTIGEALARYQEKGLPNKAVLAQEFTLLADKLAAQEPAEGQKSGFRQNLQSWLAKWISIRPQGKAAGRSAAAVLARMENALAKGDYETALAEAANLPRQTQVAIQIYTDIIRLRLNADIFFRQAAKAIFPPDEAAPNPGKTGDKADTISSPHKALPHTP